MSTLSTTRRGNTNLSSTKRNRAKAYCLTFNNYSEEVLSACLAWFEANCTDWICGEEVGEKGTPHLQCYIRFKNQKDFSIVKKEFPTAHIERAKGTLKQNYTYCSKDNKFHTNIDLRSPTEKLKQLCLDEYKDVEWKPWQKSILDILDGKPDNREINWFWETTGNVGKSFLCKYLAITRDVIICDGKKDNVFNQVNKLIESGGVPRIILLDIPRKSLDYVNYGALEQLKNGLIYSGKYEGCQCAFPIPHVIAFANKCPDFGAMSMDRWRITEVSKPVIVV